MICNSFGIDDIQPVKVKIYTACREHLFVSLACNGYRCARRSACVFLLLRRNGFFAPCVDKVQPEVDAYNDQIDKVKRHDVGELLIYDLAYDSRDIADYDSNDENYTFSFS